MHTAEAAHVTGDKLAKAVVLIDEDGYLVAVIPATFKLKMGLVHASLVRVGGSDFKKLMGEDRQAFLGEHI